MPERSQMISLIERQSKPPIRVKGHMKVCTICKEDKSISEYYPIYYKKLNKTYLQSRCKSCDKIVKNKWSSENKAEIREQKRDYRERTREERNIQSKNYYRKADPKKIKARSILGYHVRYGKIIKPELCEGCMEKQELHGHHIDYDKPLDVKWLCITCHAKEHVRIK